MREEQVLPPGGGINDGPLVLNRPVDLQRRDCDRGLLHTLIVGRVVQKGTPVVRIDNTGKRVQVARPGNSFGVNCTRVDKLSAGRMWGSMFPATHTCVGLVNIGGVWLGSGMREMGANGSVKMP